MDFTLTHHEEYNIMVPSYATARTKVPFGKPIYNPHFSIQRLNMISSPFLNGRERESAELGGNGWKNDFSCLPPPPK